MLPQVIRHAGAAAPAFDPSTVSGLAGWWKADALALAADAAVASWTDSSGNSRALTQGTGGQQPIYKQAIQNGLPIVRFDGVDDNLSAAFTFVQPETVFAALKITTPSLNQYVIDGRSNSSMTIYQNPSAGNLRQFAGAQPAGITGIDWSVFHVVSALYSSTASDMRVDGGTATSGDAGTSGGGGITLGASGNSSANATAADFAEVLIYNTAVSFADRHAIEAYLKTKWATP